MFEKDPRKIHGEVFFKKSCRFFTKKDPTLDVLWEFSRNFQNSYFAEHLQAPASVIDILFAKVKTEYGGNL